MLHQCFWSTHQLAVVVYTSQYLFFHSRLTFTVSMFIAHFIEALRCINLMTSPFRISEWFQLQWLDCIQKVVFFYNSWPFFSPSAAFARKKKNEKISGVAWTPLDTEEHWMIMETRHKFRGLSLRLMGDLFCMNTYSVPRRA